MNTAEKVAKVIDLKERRRMKIVQKISGIAENLTHRPYQDSDYEIAHHWWVKHNGWHLEKHMLSPLGVVITEGEKPIAMGWVYFSNASISQLGWVVTSPDIGPKLGISALLRLYIIAEELIILHGFRSIQMNSDNSTLTRVGEMLGWKKMKPHDFLIRSLARNDDDV